MALDWTKLASVDDAAARDRVRLAVEQELALAKSGSWRRDAAVLSTSLFLSFVGCAAFSKFGLGWAVQSFGSRAPTLALLLLAQIVGVVGAIAPRARIAQFAALGLSVSAMAAVVLLRHESAPSASPEWLCTVSHVLLAVLPLALALRMVRRAAVTPMRALCAGLASGTMGMLLGELTCGRDAAHLALFHLPAWALLAVSSVLLARRLKPESFAP